MTQTAYGIARSKLGLQEVRDRKQLMTFFKENGIDCDPATTPWCAAFVNSCTRAALRGGTGKLNARSFLEYGNEIEGDDVVEGDIIVLERGTDGWSGHVGFFIKYDDDNNLVHILGGNQQNQVTIAAYVQDHILGIRRVP